MVFKDRYDAAMQLIPLLEKYKDEPGVVLAVPRGGVPIGYHIAQHFHFPLELLLTKKIGHPTSKELAIGAVSLVSEVIDDRIRVPGEYVRKEIRNIRQGLKEKYHKYMGDREPLNVRDRTVIIVDDGIATGNTLLAAVKLMRIKRPAKIIVAVPVAPHDALRKFAGVVDELVCCQVPKNFFGVGQFYEDFSEVSDREVIDMLRDIESREAAA